MLLLRSTAWWRRLRYRQFLFFSLFLFSHWRSCGVYLKDGKKIQRIYTYTMRGVKNAWNRGGGLRKVTQNSANYIILFIYVCTGLLAASTCHHIRAILWYMQCAEVSALRVRLKLTNSEEGKKAHFVWNNIVTFSEIPKKFKLVYILMLGALRLCKRGEYYVYIYTYTI